MAQHRILVSIAEEFAASLSEERLAAIARQVLEAEGTLPVELSVAVTDDDTVRALNREYAGEDAVTDVLSFSQREGEEFVAPPGGVSPLGEVIIAYPQALRQAQDRLLRQALRLRSGQAQGRLPRQAARPSTGPSTGLRAGSGRPFDPSTKLRAGRLRVSGGSVEEEVARLLIHGILHLLGYDHAQPQEERRMRAREEELLTAVG